MRAQSAVRHPALDRPDDYEVVLDWGKPVDGFVVGFVIRRDQTLRRMASRDAPQPSYRPRTSRCFEPNAHALLRDPDGLGQLRSPFGLRSSSRGSTTRRGRRASRTWAASPRLPPNRGHPAREALSVTSSRRGSGQLEPRPALSPGALAWCPCCRKRLSIDFGSCICALPGSG